MTDTRRHSLIDDVLDTTFKFPAEIGIRKKREAVAAELMKLRPHLKRANRFALSDDFVKVAQRYSASLSPAMLKKIIPAALVPYETTWLEFNLHVRVKEAIAGSISPGRQVDKRTPEMLGMLIRRDIVRHNAFSVTLFSTTKLDSDRGGREITMPHPQIYLIETGDTSQLQHAETAGTKPLYLLGTASGGLSENGQDFAKGLRAFAWGYRGLSPIEESTSAGEGGLKGRDTGPIVNATGGVHLDSVWSMSEELERTAISDNGVPMPVQMVDDVVQSPEYTQEGGTIGDITRQAAKTPDWLVEHVQLGIDSCYIELLDDLKKAYNYYTHSDGSYQVQDTDVGLLGMIKSITNDMIENSGIMRFLIAVLAMLADVPTTMVPVQPVGARTLGMVHKRYMDYHTVNLDVPAIEPIRYIQKQINKGMRSRRRRHLVRQFWRSYRTIDSCPDNPIDTHLWEYDLDNGYRLCGKCLTEGRRIEEHARGDATLGWVTKDYNVRKNKRAHFEATAV